MYPCWPLFVVVVVVLSVLCLEPVEAFTPTTWLQLLQLAPSSRTHKAITRDAHVAVAKRVISENSDSFPDPSVTLSRVGFRQAADDLQKAVAEPDFGTYHASEHFDAETFDAGNEGILKLLLQIRQNIRAGAMLIARRNTGLALHTIQDFYSHSNWIEIKGYAITHPQVGVEKMGPISDQGGVADACCEDCTWAQKLTSGYFKSTLNGDGGPKPAGKCSHGGPNDRTSFTIPTDGINKDTTSSLWSPHKYLHFQAADAAMQASIRFIDSIRKNPDDPVNDDKFSEFIGLTLGKTLCFVVDTTGSMAGEIAGIRAVTSAIVTATLPAAGGEVPSNYLLVPFNDPDYGPVLKTTDPDIMISWLLSLQTYGGNDESEYTLHGLQLAVDNVRPGSTCYFYTDASAKDYYLFPYVSSNAIQRNVKIVQFKTARGVNRRRRRSRSRQKRSAYSYYDALVQMTGGSMYEISKSDSQKVSELVIGLATRKLQVALFVATNVLNNLFAEIHVDQSVKIVNLIFSGTGLSYFNGIRVISPSGVPLDVFNQTLDTPYVKGYNFTTLTPGKWSVYASLSSSGHSLSATVTATSIISFTYKFTVEEDGMHGGYEPIAGNPVVGTDYVVVVTVHGAVDPTSGNSTGLVRDVTSLLFVTMTGDVLATLSLTQVEPLVTYVVRARIPTIAFRVVLRGVDFGGNVIQRYGTSVMEPKVTEVIANVTSLPTVQPGALIDVDVIITSSASLSMWCLYVYDTGSFYWGPPLRSINIGSSVSVTVTLDFKIPSNISYGYVSTVSVTVGNCDLTSVDNFHMFYLTVERQINDPAPPVIELTSQVFPCTSLMSNCSLYTWIVHFRVHDVDSGLRYLTVISAAPQNASSLFFEPFDEGTQSTVIGNYSTTCCYPTATLRAVDGSGQISYILIGRGAMKSGTESMTMPCYTCWLSNMFILLLALMSNFLMTL